MPEAECIEMSDKNDGAFTTVLAGFHSCDATWKSATPLYESFYGALRKGPPFHGSRSSREIKIQNESCQMTGREATR